MSVWIAVPSAKPIAEVDRFVEAWRDMGYSVALRFDIGKPTTDCDYMQYGKYQGYANSVNGLVADILKMDTACEWIVTGGDDTFPDATKRAEEIAGECSKHFQHKNARIFNEMAYAQQETLNGVNWSTFGVMQPTGDGHGIESVCGSPWMGREFCQRINGGNGPLWHQYWHLFVDNELQAVVKRLGVLWQRPDLRHEHRHWSYTGNQAPDYIRHATRQSHYLEAQALFNRREKAGFPGHEPVAAVAA